MTTMRDVAKKAGVGVGTVSRALSDTGYTAKATREKIFAAADEMGYEYESASKAFAKSGIIGVMVPLLEHPFFAKMTDCLESELHKHGYKCMIFNNSGNEADPTGVVNMLDLGIISGLITLADPPSDFAGRKGKAIVSMDRGWGENVPVIRSDHSQGGRLAAEAFLESGCHRVIQFVGANLDAGTNDRHSSMEKVLRDNGCEVTSVRTPWNMMGYSYDRNVIRNYWNVVREMDGCMTNDIAAMSCLSIAMEMGVKVPEQLRIIGYDGTGITKLCYPQLSVVEQNCPALAEACVDRLLQLIKGETPEEMLTLIPVILKKRGTT